MTRLKHIIFILLIFCNLVGEVLPLRWGSAFAGVSVAVLSSVYSYQLAKNGHWIGYFFVMIALVFSVFYLSRPVIHYATNQYDSTTGEYKGNPHYHPIWEFDHVH